MKGAEAPCDELIDVTNLSDWVKPDRVSRAGRPRGRLVLRRVADQGNTVLVIEHNLGVSKSADWVVDLGPRWRQRRGMVVWGGAPEVMAGDPRQVPGPVPGRRAGQGLARRVLRV